jgi:hypothetical protein
MNEDEYANNAAEEAREAYRARQKFLKTHVIHDFDGSKTYCGLSIYRWVENDWEFTPLADKPDEVTCAKCLEVINKKRTSLLNIIIRR